MRRAVAVVAIAAGLLGFGIRTWTEASPVTPAACHAGSATLISGDAGNFSGHTFVCTDGTLVPVSSYGR